MEISHRVTFNKFSNVEVYLNDLGIKYKKIELPGDHYTLHFDIKESDPNWIKIFNLIKEKDGFSIPVTIFTNDEILSAQFCLAIPSFETEYPFPEDRWVEAKNNFYENYCNKCGTYTKQKEPYRVYKEPNLRGNYFMTLVWGNLNVFITYTVESGLNKLTNIETRPVYIKNTDVKSNSITQLVIDMFTEEGIIPNLDVKSSTCPICHTLKYNYPKRGTLMYTPSKLKDVDLQYTIEWFGDGLEAFHLPIFSHKIVEKILTEKWKGLQFKPVLLQENTLN